MNITSETTIKDLLDHRIIKIRTFNICERFRLLDAGAIYQHYVKYNDFMIFQNLGVKSNSELINICESFELPDLIERNVSESPIIKKSKIALFSDLYFSLNANQKHTAENLFVSLQFKLSVRAKNAFLKLCERNTLSNLLLELQKINFELNRIKNIGAKTIEEINSFLEGLNSRLIVIDLPELFEINQAEDLIRELNILIFYEGSEIDDFLKNNFSLFRTGTFPLLEFFDIMIKKGQLVKKKHVELLVNFSGIYNEEENNGAYELYQKLKLSKERVRQLLVNEKIHEKAIKILVECLELFKKYGFVIPAKFYFTKIFYPCRFQILNDATNFSDLFFSVFLNQINSQFILLKFDIGDGVSILIDKWCLEKLQLEILINKINEIRNTKIEEDFDIHLPGFVRNFIIGNISLEDQQRLTGITEMIIDELFELNPDSNNCLIIKRNIRKKPWEFMRDILKERAQEMHVDEIALEMRKLDFECDAQMVRSNVIKNSSFILMGSSIYGLKEWENELDAVGGTIKQIIVKYLENLDHPAHLTEIAKYVMQHRETNIRSIHGNLQLDPLKRYRSFGHRFYGLNDKQYSKTYNFNRVSKQWFREVTRLYSNSESKMMIKSDILRHIAQLFDVEEIQIEFLLNQRIERGELIVTKEKMLKLK